MGKLGKKRHTHTKKKEVKNKKGRKRNCPSSGVGYLRWAGEQLGASGE